MLVDNIDNVLGANSADNRFTSENVVANKDGSLLERVEYLQSTVENPIYNSANYLAVPITFAALTTGSVATHELFTVTGLVRVKILAVCSTNVAGSGTIELGVENATGSFIGTTTGTDIDAGELWYDTSPTTVADTTSTAMLDKIVNAEDIGYEVKTDTLTGGVITFHLWYWPLDAGSTVTAKDGTTTL